LTQHPRDLPSKPQLLFFGQLVDGQGVKVSPVSEALVVALRHSDAHSCNDAKEENGQQGDQLEMVVVQPEDRCHVHYLCSLSGRFRVLLFSFYQESFFKKIPFFLIGKYFFIIT
jgi:hypothetical protein